MLFVNKNIKIIFYSMSFLFLITISITLGHFDIAWYLDNDGLLVGDDRAYFEKALLFDYSDIENWIWKVKNTGYYFLNYIFIHTYIYNPILEIKIFNGLIFVLSIYMFLNSISEYRKQSFFYMTNYIVILLTIPLLQVLSINYKDGLLFSIILMCFAIINFLFNKKRDVFDILLITALLTLLFSAETIRQGNALLFLLSILISHFFFKRKLNYFRIVFYIVFSFLLFSFLFDYVLELYGRNLDSYREYFSNRMFFITGINNLDIMLTGVFKTIFQLNPISAFNFLSSSDGIHGYDSFLFKYLYVISILIWNFTLMYLMIYKSAIKKEYTLLVVFLSLYISIYSYIYVGMIGIRLAFIMYLIFALIFAKVIFAKVIFEKRKQHT